MILLLGGTSETSPMALALAEKGYTVLVSTATDAQLDIPAHPLIFRRIGRLDAQGMRHVVTSQNIRAIVDATHPYATAARATASEVAHALGIPLFRFVRPGVVDEADVFHAADHEEAARLAFSLGLPVLLTTGSRNLEPYARQSRQTGLRLVVRVLDHSESIDACLKVGIQRENIIAGRGPYSLEQNRSTIRDLGIGVLVTKDSGSAGGVEEKLEAARLEGCKVVVVRRPPEAVDSCNSIDELVAWVCASVA